MTRRESWWFPCALSAVLGQGGCANGDVGACVEQLSGRSAIARRRVERDIEQADGGPAAMLANVIDNAKRFFDGAEGVPRLQRLEVTYEVDVPATLDIDENSDELVVGVQAAREDDR
jgi:hypothetical protein